MGLQIHNVTAITYGPETKVSAGLATRRFYVHVGKPGAARSEVIVLTLFGRCGDLEMFRFDTDEDAACPVSKAQGVG